MYRLLVALFASLVLVQCQPTLSGYPQFVDLSSYLRNFTTGNPLSGLYYGLYWGTNGTILRIGIVVQIGQPNGWVSFGISDTGMMVPTSGLNDGHIAYILGGVGSVYDMALGASVAYVPNRCSADATAAVCPDTTRTGLQCKDNTALVSASTNASYTLIEFTRPIVASDGCDRAVMLDGTATNILFAVGPRATDKTWPANIIQHTARALNGNNAPITITFSINEGVTSSTAPSSTGTGSGSSQSSATVSSSTQSSANSTTSSTSASTSTSTSTSSSTTMSTSSISSSMSASESKEKSSSGFVIEASIFLCAVVFLSI